MAELMPTQPVEEGETQPPAAADGMDVSDGMAPKEVEASGELAVG